MENTDAFRRGSATRARRPYNVQAPLRTNLQFIAIYSGAITANARPEY